MIGVVVGSCFPAAVAIGVSVPLGEQRLAVDGLEQTTPAFAELFLPPGKREFPARLTNVLVVSFLPRPLFPPTVVVTPRRGVGPSPGTIAIPGRHVA